MSHVVYCANTSSQWCIPAIADTDTGEVSAFIAPLVCCFSKDLALISLSNELLGCRFWLSMKSAKWDHRLSISSAKPYTLHFFLFFVFFCCCCCLFLQTKYFSHYRHWALQENRKKERIISFLLPEKENKASVFRASTFIYLPKNPCPLELSKLLLVETGLLYL